MPFRRGVPSRRRLLASLAIGSLPGQVRSIDPPAAPVSGMPFFAQAPDGALLLSWTDQLPGNEHAFRFSRWTGLAWTTPETIARGRNFLFNWADFGSLTALPDGSLLAHWLTRPEGAGRYGYGIRLARRSADRPGWREIHGLNLEGREDYAGFLAFAPGTGAATYLTPPADPGPADASGGHEHRKTIRFIEFGAGGRWTTPRPVHADGWKIFGCPTEGPSLVTHGDRVDLAWLTRAGGQARIQLARSSDRGQTFASPLRLDSGQPLGRPVLLRLDAAVLLAAWLEKKDNGVVLQARRVLADNVLRPAVGLAKVPLGRDSGFPKLALRGDRLFIAWRDERVRVLTLGRPDFERKEEK